VSSEQRRVYRSRAGAIIALVCAFLSPVAISLPALLSPGRMNTVAQAFFVALGLVLAVLFLRAAVSAVRIEASGVRVVNPLSVRRYSWADIECFTLGRWGLLPRNCLVNLRGGSRIGVWAISARNPNFFRHDSAAEGMVAELNQRLKEVHVAPD
jgi:hypothetical protein